jgi:hypothetical protein
VSKRGECRFVGAVQLTALRAIETQLLAWDKRYAEPWLLATNLTRPRLILRLYHRRAWVENMLGDLKLDFVHFDPEWFRKNKIPVFSRIKMPYLNLSDLY